MNGKVILVGAGPGDKGLLTLRGAEVLQNAEVVVYDRLVGADVLAMIPDDAERIDVGKQSNRHPVPQERINEILVEKAREGKQVVRLKGGDCYLFGRGGEEVEELVTAGVPFEVVPGVTSAMSAPAYAGIPVTHRDFCSSVHIVTAHAKRGGELHIDFESLLKTGGTLVFLMGVSALGFVMNGLLAAGAPPDLPAAVVENGTRYNQRRLVATVGTLDRKTEEMGLQSPAIILVGKVCTLADTLDWFSKLPLHGKHVVVTRPRERAGTLADRLRALGAGVTEYPCIETVETPEAPLPDDLRAYHWVVLTSPAGVPAMRHALEAHGTDLRALYGCRFACIGQGTAKALAEYGIRADYVPEHFDAKHLAQGLCDIVHADERVLILRAAQGTPELTEILTAGGVAYDEAAVYETRYRSAQSDALTAHIAAGTVDFVTFTSASTVHAFVQSAPHAAVNTFRAVCIGDATAAAAKTYGMNIITAKNATIDDMIACILEGS